MVRRCFRSFRKPSRRFLAVFDFAEYSVNLVFLAMLSVSWEFGPLDRGEADPNADTLSAPKVCPGMGHACFGLNWNYR